MAAERAPKVVLLRSADGPEDRYVRALEKRSLQATCVPVLAFRFPNQDALRSCLTDPSQYAGLILTSPRAVRALEGIDLPKAVWDTWTDQPAYAVGPKTASAVRDIGFTPSGEGAGSASALESVIAKQKKPYLFLCGNRRRDVLPDALQEAGTPFEELIVYETGLRTALDIPDAREGDWLAFFSPSGIEAVTQHAADKAKGYQVAAIGPTTASALRDGGWAVDAVAETPSPDALADAILEATSTGE